MPLPKKPSRSWARSSGAAARDVRRAGLDLVWSKGHPGAKGWRRWPSSPPRRRARPRRRRDRARPPVARRDRRRIERLGLDRSKLWLGVGAGFSEKPLTRMRETLPSCATRCPACASSSPRWARRWCALAGVKVDGRRLLQLDEPLGGVARARGRADGSRRPAGTRCPPAWRLLRPVAGAGGELGGHPVEEGAFELGPGEAHIFGPIAAEDESQRPGSAPRAARAAPRASASAASPRSRRRPRARASPGRARAARHRRRSQTATAGRARSLRRQARARAPQPQTPPASPAPWPLDGHSTRPSRSQARRSAPPAAAPPQGQAPQRLQIPAPSISPYI